MATPKPHNRGGIVSALVFIATFAAWIAAIWLADKYSATPASKESAIKWIENLSIIPFGIGTFIGIRAIYQRDTNPMFPFAGFALNGIMVLRIVYAWLGWALGL